MSRYLKLWREHGGRTFGPYVEHVSMPEDKLDGFMTAATADLVAALKVAHVVIKLLADEYDVDPEGFTFYDAKVRTLGAAQLQIAAALANAGAP